MVPQWTVTAMAVIFLGSCEKPYIPFHTSEEGKKVEYTYLKYRDFLVTGLWESAYPMHSSAKRELYPFEQFKKDLEPTWGEWQGRMRTGEIISSGVEGEFARLLVRFEAVNRPPEVIYFVKEKDEWKIDHYVPPGAVMAPQKK